MILCRPFYLWSFEMRPVLRRFTAEYLQTDEKWARQHDKPLVHHENIQTDTPQELILIANDKCPATMYLRIIFWHAPSLDTVAIWSSGKWDEKLRRLAFGQ